MHVLNLVIKDMVCIKTDVKDMVAAQVGHRIERWWEDSPSKSVSFSS